MKIEGGAKDRRKVKLENFKQLNPKKKKVEMFCSSQFLSQQRRKQKIKLKLNPDSKCKFHFYFYFYQIKTYLECQK